jgi:hypothetical protein
MFEWFDDTCQRKTRCAEALLEVMAPIREADVRDRAACLKFACERFEVLAEVLGRMVWSEDSAVFAKVDALKSDAMAIISAFACSMLLRAR